MSKPPLPLRIRCLTSADAVIVGASTGAVAAALALREQGCSVVALSDRSSFGEETAGALNLWSEGLDLADPLVNAMFAGGSFRFPGPMKHALEQKLLQSGCRFFYWIRPVAILRDEAGNIGGLLLAGRTALFAIRCRTVIDASRFGIVARLAGIPLRAARPESPSLQWNILAQRRPAAWAGQAERIGAPFALPGSEQEPLMEAWTIRLPLQGAGAPPIELPHLARAALLDSGVRLSAETLPIQPVECHGATTLVDDLPQLPEASLKAENGLYLANGLLPVSAEGLRPLERADAQARLGRRVAAVAGAEMRQAAPAGPLMMAAGADGGFQFAPVFLRDAAETISLPMPHFPELGQCDVAVAGGGTAGAPAGIAAAREGADAVVLEIQHGMGGVGTLGLIGSYWFGNRTGFTAEIDGRLRQMDPERVKHSQWNPELKMALYHRMLQEAGGRAWMHSFAFGVRRENDRVSGLLVSHPHGAGLLQTGCVVDASGSADVAAAAGAKCRWIDGHHVAVQGAGLSPRRLQKDYSNSDHTFIDDSDPEGVTHAFVNARAKFAGEFDTASFVDTRERRNIVGDFELSPLDILANRTFPDTIVTANSNFDTHGFTVHPVFAIMPPNKAPLHAHVSLRCMLPAQLEGVLVTGLGMSAHRDALPVVRMQADVQNQGYAAGLATAMASAGNGALRKIDIRGLQGKLVEAGILDSSVLTHQDSFPLPRDAVTNAVREGPVSLHNAAVLLTEQARSKPMLLAELHHSDAERRLNAALVLGLMGEPAAAAILCEAVRSEPWDEGWNFRGMGQFGLSMSRLDAFLVALGRTRAPEAASVVAEKIRALDGGSAFSHCRAVSIACCCLRAKSLADPLHQALLLPGVQGHAHLTTAQAVAIANSSAVETEARNLSLRELYLARALLLCGDVESLGRRILETYSRDLRGIYARHARAVLATASETANALEIG